MECREACNRTAWGRIENCRPTCLKGKPSACFARLRQGSLSAGEPTGRVRITRFASVHVRVSTRHAAWILRLEIYEPSKPSVCRADRRPMVLPATLPIGFPAGAFREGFPAARLPCRRQYGFLLRLRLSRSPRYWPASRTSATNPLREHGARSRSRCSRHPCPNRRCSASNPACKRGRKSGSSLRL